MPQPRSEHAFGRMLALAGRTPALVHGTDGPVLPMLLSAERSTTDGYTERVELAMKHDDLLHGTPPTPIVSGIRLTEDQIASILTSGGEVLWHGEVGGLHDAPIPGSPLPGLNELMGKAEVWFGPGLSPSMLSQAPDLRWWQASAAGVEGLLSPELVSSQIVLTNVRGMHAATTAEHAFAIMLALARGIPGLVLSQSRTEWSPPSVHDIAGLAGTRLLVLGTGSVGRAIATRALTFGMVVSGVNRSGKPAPEFARVSRAEDLASEVTSCDWFVVACPLTAETRGLVSSTVILALRKDAILVNVARGAVIDEPALVLALQSRAIRAAGLDVFTEEPLPSDSALWKLPNALITPHAGGIMTNYAGLAVEYFVRNLALYRKGEPLNNIVDKEAGY
jgi:phosphoglycerate dehydrogenase-like enzyme